MKKNKADIVAQRFQEEDKMQTDSQTVLKGSLKLVFTIAANKYHAAMIKEKPIFRTYLGETSLNKEEITIFRICCEVVVAGKKH